MAPHVLKLKREYLRNPLSDCLSREAPQITILQISKISNKRGTRVQKLNIFLKNRGSAVITFEPFRVER